MKQNDARISPLVNDQWVCIAPDDCSSGVWAKDGANVDEDELPVTPELKQRIQAWHQKWEAKCDACQNGQGMPAYKLVDHMLEMLWVAAAIKRQLPDWTVVFRNSVGGQPYFDLPMDEHGDSEATKDLLIVGVQGQFYVRPW